MLREEEMKDVRCQWGSLRKSGFFMVFGAVKDQDKTAGGHPVDKVFLSVSKILLSAFPVQNCPCDQIEKLPQAPAGQKKPELKNLNN